MLVWGAQAEKQGVAVTQAIQRATHYPSQLYFSSYDFCFTRNLRAATQWNIQHKKLQALIQSDVLPAQVEQPLIGELKRRISKLKDTSTQIEDLADSAEPAPNPLLNLRFHRLLLVMSELYALHERPFKFRAKSSHRTPDGRG